MKLSLEEKQLIKIALHNTIAIYFAQRRWLNKAEEQTMENFGNLLYRFENNGERPTKH